MEVIDNPALVVFAAVAPLLIAFVKQSGWSKQINALVAFACYVGVGIAGALASGVPLSLETAVPFIASITVVGAVAYNMIWSNLGGETSIEERIQVSTSFIR